MEPSDVTDLIEDGVPDAEVEVSQPRGVDDDDHLAATVVSPAFEGESLVDQHALVHDAVEEYRGDALHALEVTTYTPEEYERLEVDGE